VQALDRAEQVQLHLMLLSLCATFPCFRQNAPTCLRQRACQPFGKERFSMENGCAVPVLLYHSWFATMFAQWALFFSWVRWSSW
jgi:hypothetical protein